MWVGARQHQRCWRPFADVQHGKHRAVATAGRRFGRGEWAPGRGAASSTAATSACGRGSRTGSPACSTFFFLFAHVLDTALVRVSPNAYDRVISLYKNPLVNLMELGLVGAVLYHALNGLRVMLVDFWSKGPKVQRVMLWTIIVIWVAVMIPSAYFMLQYNVEKLFGSGN